MSQKVEKVQKWGGGSTPEIKKSTIQNVDFLMNRQKVEVGIDNMKVREYETVY